MKRVVVFSTCIVATLRLTSLCCAEVTDFTIDPNPVFLGQWASYDAVDNGQDAIESYKWEYKCAGVPCGQLWREANNHGPSFALHHTSTGSYNVRLTVKYAGMPMGPPPRADTVITKNVDVVPPDQTSAIVAGTGVWKQFDESQELRIDLRANGVSLNSDIFGYPQEYIIVYMSGGILNSPPVELDWFPVPPGDKVNEPNFHLAGSVIVDVQAQEIDQANWNAIANGIYSNIDISYRIVVKDCCGNQDEIDVGTFNLIRVKNGNQWKIIIN